MVKHFKVFFRTRSQIILKLGMEHQGLKFDTVLNDELRLTLAYFTAMSHFVACVFEWGKLLQSLNEKSFQKMTKLTQHLFL